MPLLIAMALSVAAMLFAIAFAPFALILRYRMGTRRRRVRRWIATLNVMSLLFSVAFFLITAAVTSQWVPSALSYSSIGLAAGAVLGIVGLSLTRWERESSALYYTPSRLLMLTLSIVVAARIAYGFWRGWQAWQTAPDTTSWLAAVGIAGSMSAGALVLGYYLMYTIGVRVRAMSLRQ